MSEIETQPKPKHQIKNKIKTPRIANKFPKIIIIINIENIANKNNRLNPDQVLQKKIFFFFITKKISFCFSWFWGAQVNNRTI